MAGLNGGRKRQVASAIDILTQECDSLVGGAAFTELSIKQLTPYHNHCFRLYEGRRLADMVESIKEHGVLIPVVVLRIDAAHYEILSGHNRTHAAELAGLEAIPAVVKEGLTEGEALAYVVETNLMQRSFSEMLPSEQAVALKVRYDALSCQGRRNDILRELKLLETGEDMTSAPLEQKSDTRDTVGEEYGLKHASVARLLRLNYLIDEFKELVDNKSLALRVADDVSFLTEDAQHWLYEAMQAHNYKLTMKNVTIFKEKRDELTRDLVFGLVQGALSEKKPPVTTRKVAVTKTSYDRYFKGRSEEEIQTIMEQALSAWFADSKGKREGVLIYAEDSDRMDIDFGKGDLYGELHCGNTFEVLLGGAWVPTRIEYDEEWYLVGVPVAELAGLRVRVAA